MDTAREATESEIWCRGARLVGSRPLEDVERNWARSLRARHLQSLLLGTLGFPAATMLILVIGTRIIEIPNDGAQIAGAGAMFMAMILGPTLAIMIAMEHGGVLAKLGRDLRDGRVSEFEFPSSREVEEADPEFGPAPSPRFAMLPASRRIVTIGSVEQVVKPEVLLEVVGRPAIEFYAPLSLQVVAPLPDLEFAQRPLSLGERDEIFGVRRRLILPRLSTVVALATLGIGLGVAQHVAQSGFERWPTLAEMLWFGLVLLICVRALVRYSRGLLLAGRLSRDIETGLVVRVVGGEPRDAEMLPFSRVVWRVAGAPAGWRDRRHGAESLRASL